MSNNIKPTQAEKTAMDTVIDTLVNGFSAYQTLNMAFAVCSSICKALIAQQTNDRDKDFVRSKILSMYVEKMIEEFE